MAASLSGVPEQFSAPPSCSWHAWGGLWQSLFQVPLQRAKANMKIQMFDFFFFLFAVFYCLLKCAYFNNFKNNDLFSTLISSVHYFDPYMCEYFFLLGKFINWTLEEKSIFCVFCLLFKLDHPSPQ